MFLVIFSQAYRLLSTAFFHLSLMHIAFNCMTLHTVGSAIELRVGTISFTICTIVLIPCCGLMNVASSIAFNFLGFDQGMKECASGFSGVLFAYVTIQAFHPASSAYSVYGLFSVPAKFYPMVMLIITQMLLPQSSFVGHLGGIAAGCVFSLVDSNLPSFSSFLQRVESFCPACLSSFCAFAPCPRPIASSSARIISGIIVNDSFHRSPNFHQDSNEASDVNQPPAAASWFDRLRSLFQSRYSPCPFAVFAVFCLASIIYVRLLILIVRYTPLRDIEMQNATSNGS
jgi:membrane associated rhomboid family serine protease